MNTLDILLRAIEVVGGASALAFALRNAVLPILTSWADKTATSVDNVALERLSTFLEFISALADIANTVSSVIALNPRNKPAVTQNEKEIP